MTFAGLGHTPGVSVFGARRPQPTDRRGEAKFASVALEVPVLMHEMDCRHAMSYMAWPSPLF